MSRTKQIQISDMFGTYPEIDDPNFNKLLSQKEEFLELRPGLTEPRPGPGKGFRHQRFAVRILTWYDRMLLLHYPGTGKSCIIAHSAELFKREYLKNPDDPTKIKRAIILIRGAILKGNIRNEIVCKCTNHIYETDFVMRANNEKTMHANVKRELDKWYDIMSYHQFASQIRKFQREEDLEEFMSNKAIYVDEAHGIRKITDITGYYIPALTIMDVLRSGQVETIQQTLFRAFHKGHRNLIVLATATPMINLAIDMIPLVNMILPVDKLIPPMKEEEFVNLEFAQLEPYFRGRTSYIRAVDTGAIKQAQGDVVTRGNEQLLVKVYTCEMSKFQYKSYLRAKNIDGAFTGDTKKSFYDHTRQASNFVFPDGSYGNEGFSKYTMSVKNIYGYPDTPEGAELRKRLRNMESLKELSAKYHEIVQLCKDSYAEKDVDVVLDDERGIIFVYFADYIHGSGAIMLGFSLKEQGYDEFKENKSIFLSSQEINVNIGPCSHVITEKTDRPIRIPPKPRYAILTSKTNKSQIPTILSTINCYENRFGQYVQILIGSKTAREGISVNNSVKMIMASSNWNQSTNLQSENRVFRTTSHEMRIADKKQRLGRDDVTIDVKTYNMVAVYEGDENDPDRLYQKDDFDTIDVGLFAASEAKDRQIHKILRIIKQSSIDCFVNKERNVRPGVDQDGTAICDYTTCDYTCAGIPENFDEYLQTHVDHTTKLLHYSEDEVEEASLAIKKLFSKFHSLKNDQIYTFLSKIRPVYIDMALEKMIRENVRIVDRLGFFGFIRESENGVIYVERDQFEVLSRPENTVYNSVLIGTQDPRNNIFRDYITYLNLADDQQKMDKLADVNPGDPRFTTILNSLSLISKVTLLEFVILERERTRKTNPFFDAIIVEFFSSTYNIVEPVNRLQQVAMSFANRGKSRGRKPNPTSKIRIRGISAADIQNSTQLPFFDINQPPEKVYIHTLLNQGAHERTSYSETSKYFKAEGQIRILKMSERIGWRDVNEYEYVVYNSAIQLEINRAKMYFEQFPIYGIVIPPNNILRIRDRERETPDAEKDKRNINDGRKCNDWDKMVLIDVMFRLGIGPINEVPPNVTRDTMLAELLTQSFERLDNPATYSNEKLRYFYSWVQGQTNRKTMCVLLREHFERTGKLFKGRTPSNVTNQYGQVGTIQTGPSPVTYDAEEQDLSDQSIESTVEGIPLLQTQTLPDLSNEVSLSGTSLVTAPVTLPNLTEISLPGSSGAQVPNIQPMNILGVVAQSISEVLTPGIQLSNLPTIKPIIVPGTQLPTNRPPQMQSSGVRLPNISGLQLAGTPTVQLPNIAELQTSTTLPPTTLPPTTLPPTILSPNVLPPRAISPTVISPTTLSPTVLPPRAISPTTVRLPNIGVSQSMVPPSVRLPNIFGPQ